MLLSIIQVLSYTYNKGISPDIKYKLGEINYDIEEYWYGGRLWSKTSSSSSLSGNKLMASRIVGSSGISFTDDTVVLDEDGEEDDEGGVVGFITSLLNGRFGGQDEGVDDGEDKDEGGNQEQVVVAENNVKSEKADVTSSNVGVDPTLKKENSPEILNPIFATTTNNDNNNIKTTMKRRPAMAHVISISDSRHPAHHLPRSSSRRMKHNGDHHRNKWTLSRIVGTIIWIGLMIPILEVVIRELSRRYRLGSLLRRTRIRLTRGFLLRRGLSGGENVHNL
jgi:hypothetical protein